MRGAKNKIIKESKLKNKEIRNPVIKSLEILVLLHVKAIIETIIVPKTCIKRSVGIGKALGKIGNKKKKTKKSEIKTLNREYIFSKVNALKTQK